MERYGPYTVAQGQTTTVEEPRDSKATSVLLANASPFVCEVDVAGPQQWLAPWTVDQYAYTPGAVVQVTPALEINGASTDNTLLVTYLELGDITGGAYPQPLTTQAIAASIAGAVTMPASMAASAIGPAGVSQGSASILPAIAHGQHYVVFSAYVDAGASTLTVDIHINANPSAHLLEASNGTLATGFPTGVLCTQVDLGWGGASGGDVVVGGVTYAIVNY